MSEIESAYLAATNKLVKWRMVFASRWLGTRLKTDPEVIAVRDFAEKYLLLRVEVTALIGLLIEKRMMTEDELKTRIIAECGELEAMLEKAFPGFRASAYGMDVDLKVAQMTVKGWPP